MSPQTDTTPKDADLQNNSQTTVEHDRKSLYDSYSDSRQSAKSNIDQNAYNRDVYGELNLRPANRVGNSINERLLIERRTPDAYGRSVTMGLYNTQKVGDYEDVYASYAAENEYGKTHGKLLPKTPQPRDVSANHEQMQDYAANYVSFCNGYLSLTLIKKNIYTYFIIKKYISKLNFSLSASGKDI